MQSAQARPDLGQAGPTATFAGRLVPQGQPDLAKLLMQPPTESPDAEGMGVAGPAIAGAVTARSAAAAKTAAKNATRVVGAGPLVKALGGQELGPLEKLIVERGDAGMPMQIENFRPRLTNRKTGQTLLGGQGGRHGEMYEKIPGSVNTRDWEHGYSTPEGISVADELTYLLTGPPELLKQAGQMVSSGTTIDMLTKAIRDAMTRMGGHSAPGMDLLGK